MHKDLPTSAAYSSSSSGSATEPADSIRMTASNIQIRPFQSSDEKAFRQLNEEWIAKHFNMEEKDHVTLGDPVGKILKPGGHIFIAVANGEPIGCCALLAMKPGEFELAKMAVAERHRGHGVGRQVLRYTIEQARALGVRRLYLETSSKLPNAIHLYESVGFQHLPPERLTPSPYARSDVYMEMLL
jgi:putative acetyltransferase